MSTEVKHLALNQFSVVDRTFCGVASAAVEQVASGPGSFGQGADPECYQTELSILLAFHDENTGFFSEKNM